jgi:peptidoglycan/xylan/chitin deacetylase (PgdA/CDA1 family)
MRCGGRWCRTLVVSLFLVGQGVLTGCGATKPAADTSETTNSKQSDSSPSSFNPMHWINAIRAFKSDDADTIRVPILVYHSIAPHHPGQTGEQRELDVDPAAFRAQMDHIVQHRHPVVPLSAIVAALRGRGSIPDRAVAITFDDGWQNQYDDALGVLRDHGFTATFFVYTKVIDNGPGFMTWDELRQLKSAGMTIGSHTRTHPDLTQKGVSLKSEIVGSREDIQKNLGTAPDLFAYPYGDWDDRVAEAVRSAGYVAARGMGEGPANSKGNLFALKSIQPTDDMEAFERALGDRPAPSAAGR